MLDDVARVAILWFLGASVVSLIQFAVDKSQAVNLGRRLPEATLLATAMGGGAFGAKLGQRLFRHKTRKQPFERNLNSVFVVNPMIYEILFSPRIRARIAELPAALTK